MSDIFQVRTTEDKEYKSSGEETILDAALSSDLIFNYSCKNGQCGTCKTELLYGEVEEISPQLALTTEDKQNNKILTCCCSPKSDILIDAEDLSVLHGIETKTLPVRISSLKLLSSEIIEVKFRFPPNTLFNYLEGQFIDVIGPNSVRRSYSIANASVDNASVDNAGVSLLIKKVKEGILSEYWFNHAKINDLLRIEGPKGTFFLRNTSKRLLFLATGTGIAPIIGILNKLDLDDEFKQLNKISLFWGNRQSEDFIWSPEFNKIKVDYHPVVSNPDPTWKDSVGYVQDIALSKNNNIQNTHIYACGSNAMIESARKDCIDKGLEEKNFFSDAFVQSY